MSNKRSLNSDKPPAEAGWKQLSIEYLKGRVADLQKDLRPADVDWDGQPFTIKKGCRVPASGKRSDGYAQLKLRGTVGGVSRQWAPRAYEVILFVEGITKADGDDVSHLCGRGAMGCVERTHLHVEAHQSNLSRKRTTECHLRATCPNCSHEFALFACPGHGDEPRCL